MALTGGEVGRAATTGAIALLLGLLVLVLNDRSDGPPTSAADDGRSTLRLLAPTPTPSGAPTQSATPVTPLTPPGAALTTATPLTSTPPTAATTPSRTAATVPSAAPGPVTVVVLTPTPSGTTPSATTPTPNTSPAGRVTIVSDLPTGCGRLGEACRYAEAPSSAQLGEGPRSVTVTSPSAGALRVTATAGAGGRPASVGFVVRVCRCTESSDDVLVEARVSPSPGSVLELQGVSGPVRIWVQELNEAGLSRGVSYDVPATPTPSPSP